MLLVPPSTVVQPISGAQYSTLCRHARGTSCGKVKSVCVRTGAGGGRVRVQGDLYHFSSPHRPPPLLCLQWGGAMRVWGTIIHACCAKDAAVHEGQGWLILLLATTTFPPPQLINRIHHQGGRGGPTPEVGRGELQPPPPPQEGQYSTKRSQGRQKSGE